MRRTLRENGLALAFFGLFLACLAAQTVMGYFVYNQNQKDHNQAQIGFTAYLGTGHFVEAVFENWESEFLQDGAYIFLTVFLVQKGSSESKKLEGGEEVDADPRGGQSDPNAPWAVRRGGLWLSLYKNSMLIAFLLLFALSFGLHAAGGAREYSQEQIEHGGQPVSMLGYLGTSQFWFESFQNWQSEFLAVFSIVVLSIFLRQQGSPESKPVASPHSETGSA
jgi:hypothetical protein